MYRILAENRDRVLKSPDYFKDALLQELVSVEHYVIKLQKIIVSLPAKDSRAVYMSSFSLASLLTAFENLSTHMAGDAEQMVVLNFNKSVFWDNLHSIADPGLLEVENVLPKSMFPIPVSAWYTLVAVLEELGIYNYELSIEVNMLAAKGRLYQTDYPAPLSYTSFVQATLHNPHRLWGETFVELIGFMAMSHHQVALRLKQEPVDPEPLWMNEVPPAVVETWHSPRAPSIVPGMAASPQRPPSERGFIPSPPQRPPSEGRFVPPAPPQRPPSEGRFVPPPRPPSERGFIPPPPPPRPPSEGGFIPPPPPPRPASEYGFPPPDAPPPPPPPNMGTPMDDSLPLPPPPWDSPRVPLRPDPPARPAMTILEELQQRRTLRPVLQDLEDRLSRPWRPPPDRNNPESMLRNAILTRGQRAADSESSAASSVGNWNE